MATSVCSLQIILFLSSSSLPKGGNVDREILLQDEHSSQASSPLRLRQFRTLANSSANTFLPMPCEPVKSSDPGTRPLPSKRRRDSFPSSLPISLENITQLAKRREPRAK